ncbi:DegT/DnrJ/EryC1/StrS family aminotransferase [Streptomyces coeruleorubidus]|uniref:DegT/DnrJ/EryC1/StrS family aminotransferase n=1 Tax=Streptomyces coeruleorubidus TaxID=116188 RepID=UPI0033ECB94B
MRVALYDHAKLYREHHEAIDAAIARMLESGQFTWGEEVPAFEEEFASWVNARHAVAMGSGTAALTTALRALEIGPGDEVITVANTELTGVAAISAVGATVVWVDIDPASRCIDTTACEAAITPRTRALLPVDMYGHPADMIEMRRIADRHGLALVEDACIALGAEIDGRRLGSHADVTCFSFSPGKHLGAMGAAGACTTQNAVLADRIHRLASDGQARGRHYDPTPGIGQHHETEGHNQRMDEMQAAILRAKLPHLVETLAVRRAQADRYTERLVGLADLPAEGTGFRHAWRNYVIELDRRDELAAHLFAHGIGCNALYSPPMHLQSVYRGLGYAVGSLPRTERSGKRLLGLPLGPHLSIEQIDIVADEVRVGLA